MQFKSHAHESFTLCIRDLAHENDIIFLVNYYPNLTMLATVKHVLFSDSDGKNIQTLIEACMSFFSNYIIYVIFNTSTFPLITKSPKHAGINTVSPACKVSTNPSYTISPVPAVTQYMIN